MKKILFLLLLTGIFFSCNKNEELQEETTIQDINVDAVIEKHLSTTNTIFNWQSADIDVLWAAVQQGDYVVSIGYGEDDQYELNSNDLRVSREQLLTQVIALENQNTTQELTKEDVFLNQSDVLTYFDVYVKNKETLIFLRDHSAVRYVEPGNYIFKKEAQANVARSFGCGTAGDNINTNDYSVVAPAAWVSWNFDHHNIQTAWNSSTGENIKVGVIDTGISPEQDNFSSDFNSGYSSGRTADKDGTYVSSWWWWASPDGPDDSCGHGTLMTSTIAAPRTGENAPVGVAYNCDLLTIRASGDVVLDGYSEQRGVANAITKMANTSDLKIMSMSMGHIFSVGKISDAVKYAVNRKGKLFFVAGGTSTSVTNWYGVTFPATMSEVVAVTGVTDASNYARCAECHEGPEIDFTIVMQRASNSSRNAVALGYKDSRANYVGGSSVATATAAGIAALVWAEHPSWNKDQVLEKLKQSSEFYPNKDNNLGWGNIDAAAAVQ